MFGRRRTTKAGDESVECKPLPEIDADRCVHSRYGQAHCQACVESCPRGAWVLDEEQLGIDPSACDYCGLCAPACPEAALAHSHRPLTGEWQRQALAVCICDRCDDVSIDHGRMACVHALSLLDLLQLYRHGFIRIFVATGPCEQCERGAGERLEDRLTQLNAALVARAFPRIRLHRIEPDLAEQLVRTMKYSASTVTVSRRHFLRHAVAEAAGKSLQAYGLLEGDSHVFTPPGELMPGDAGDVPMPFVPKIDQHRCTACSACVQLCPHGAIFSTAEPAAYHTAAEKCSGCRICVDVCEEDAIVVERWAVPEVGDIPLHSARCRACGVPFVATGSLPESGLCPVCSRVNHAARLFEVQ